MQENKTNIKDSVEDEIDLIQLVKTLWEGRRTVIKTTVIFILLGLFVAIFSQKEYTASCTMVPQSAEGGSKLGGSLGGLAAMAGINLGNMGGSDIPPSLYPKIVGSIPFQKEMMKTALTVRGYEEQVSYEHYYKEIYNPGLLSYIKKYTIDLPGMIIKAFKGENSQKGYENMEHIGGLIIVSQEEKELIKRLKQQVSIEYNEKDGYISLTARMSEAKPAAQMVKKAQVLLQKAITDIKIQKAKEQLIFVEERYAEKEKEAKIAQQKLAQFRDRNKNVSTAVAQTELERLTAEYNLVYGVYSELAKQLETQKIQVKEDTPIFTIIEPVSIPIEKSKPKRAIILIVWTFLGCVVGVGVVFGNHYFETIKEEWNKEDSTSSIL
jgi:LPS O-antigen subunit length determinant protein (WzzB/FepE family)